MELYIEAGGACDGLVTRYLEEFAEMRAWSSLEFLKSLPDSSM